MSGGSYDYLYGKMQSGEIDGFGDYAERMASDLRRLAAGLADVEVCVRRMGDPEYIRGGRRKLTDKEVTEAEIAIGAALLAVQSAEAGRARLSAKMQALSDVAHTVEWRASGDYGDDTAVDALVKWMRERLKP